MPLKRHSVITFSIDKVRIEYHNISVQLLTAPQESVPCMYLYLLLFFQTGRRAASHYCY